ncbi:MAG TPA: NAD-dependent epimerase/dehydratase family protein [Thermoplasmata archaeon]|nr:NAD-dependent epimerase/dehydratase family protein [Thermoplasmata archaeon]
MKVLLFGATGMVGQGVLRECLLDPRVETVLSVGRSATGQHHPKLHEVVRGNLADLAALEDQLRGYDACFFCLGVSSAGLSEGAYRHVTYDLTVSVGRTLAGLDPGMTFIYVSGAGTDSTERGRTMWARVKGQTENALLRLPFKAAYMFRPGIIRPMHGARSKTRSYRVLYAALEPFVFLLALVAPNSITTTERMGRAMIHAAQAGAPTVRLGTREINALAR